MMILLVCGAIILNEAELYEWWEMGLIFVLACLSIAGITLLVKKPEDPEWMKTACVYAKKLYGYCKKLYYKMKTKVTSMSS